MASARALAGARGSQAASSLRQNTSGVGAPGAECGGAGHERTWGTNASVANDHRRVRRSCVPQVRCEAVRGWCEAGCEHTYTLLPLLTSTMRFPIVVAALAALVAAFAPLDAQQYFIPGSEVNGQINVQINATLNDGIGDYQPLAGLPITLYRGATTAWRSAPTRRASPLRRPPGTCRIATPEPSNGRRATGVSRSSSRSTWRS